MGRALALGTRNATFLFHAGMIERALGHDDRPPATARGARNEPALLDLHAATASACSPGSRHRDEGSRAARS
jgi:hypothetical protein